MVDSETHQQAKYIVCAPPYRSNSAGIRALYLLAEALRQQNYQALTTTLEGMEPLNPAHLSMNTGSNQLTEADARLHAQQSDWIVIYPEVVCGNPLNAKKVVRWVLNRPGFLEGDLIYDKNELVFSYSNVYLNYIYNPISGTLYIPTLDQNLFFSDPTQKRTQTCFYVGKSQFKAGYFDQNHTQEITQTTPPREKLGDLFRQCRILYCFDNSTILVYEAILCGCPVVVIPDGSHTRKDYETLELGMNGIAWGPSELERAQSTVHLVASQYSQIQTQFQKQLQDFIHITTQWELSAQLVRKPTPTIYCKFYVKKYLRQLTSKIHQLTFLRKPHS